MAKSAYLLVSDLHMHVKQKENRFNYAAEIDDVCKKIVDVGMKYKEAGYNVVMLLLGDVFDRSYNDVFGAVQGNNFFVLWSMLFGKIYACMGNHEFSFYKSNPFYTLVTDIESDKVRGKMNSVWTPRGVLPVIRVVDYLEDGDTSFYFNHYGTSISTGNLNKINIGLFHQDLACKQVLQDMRDKFGENTFGVEAKLEDYNFFDGYQYCFFGHNHKLYGTWRLDNGCYLSYLASLGRPNVTEVNDNALERDIPAILVEDGSFVRAENNKITLMSRKECVREDVVTKQQEVYEVRKEFVQAKTHFVGNQEPLENLRSYYCDNPYMLTILEGLLSGGVDEIALELKNKVATELGVDV